MCIVYNGLYVFILLHFVGLLLVQPMPCGPVLTNEDGDDDDVGDGSGAAVVRSKSQIHAHTSMTASILPFRMANYIHSRVSYTAVSS